MTPTAMEDAGHTFLTQQKKTAPSSTTPQIVGDLEDMLFKTESEAPKKNLPPPSTYQGPSPGSFHVLIPHLHKFNLPAHDDKEDPLPWINRCEQLSRGENTPETEQAWYASFHLTGGVQQGYVRTT